RAARARGRADGVADVARHLRPRPSAPRVHHGPGDPARRAARVDESAARGAASDPAVALSVQRIPRRCTEMYSSLAISDVVSRELMERRITLVTARTGSVDQAVRVA